MSNETEKDAEGRLPEATYWIAAGATASLILLFVWGAIVNGNNPNASWGSWGASFEPITGLLSSIAVAIAFVAMALQTHELRDQRKLMREQVLESKRHSDELRQQHQATAQLVAATETSTSVAALAAEVHAVQNVSLAAQAVHALQAHEETIHAFRTIERAIDGPGGFEGAARIRALQAAISAGDPEPLEALIKSTIEQVAPASHRNVVFACIRVRRLYLAEKSLRDAEAVLTVVRTESASVRARIQAGPLPLSSKTNDTDAAPA